MEFAEKPVVAVQQCRSYDPEQVYAAVLRQFELLGGVEQFLPGLLELVHAVGFQMGDLPDELAGVTHVDVAATPVLNTFNGRTNAELHLRDVKPTLQA